METGIHEGSNMPPGDNGKWKTVAIVFIVLAVVAGASLGVLLRLSYGELGNVRADLAQSQSDLAETSAQLADIQSKYPLRNFDSYAQLDDWASENLRSYDYLNELARFNAACDVAETARGEGLLVWVDFNRIDLGSGYYATLTYCCAFVESALFYWSAHEDEYIVPMQVLDLRRQWNSA